MFALNYPIIEYDFSKIINPRKVCTNSKAVSTNETTAKNTWALANICHYGNASQSNVWIFTSE